MKKILLSIFAITTIISLVAGAVYAAFSDKATSGPNTFATGNADLKIAIDTDKDGQKSAWDDSTTPAFPERWTNLYPGWEDSYWIYLKNESSSPITLKILPTVDITSYDIADLWDDVFMEITWSDGSHSTGKYSLRVWRENSSTYLEPTLAKDAEAGPWVVNFSISENAGNEIKDGSIIFDLIFDGIQII
ncbi:MAG: SipW-dependent-type signal peptide-containing protein [Patescibacteria group bacterium]|nr:SipW-dependent-type signal peptide-containing protein [Patescibacteria group bacterium]